MQQIALVKWLLLCFMTFNLLRPSGSMPGRAAKKSTSSASKAATAANVDWQGLLTDLRESWQSPLLYLQKRGYLPVGNENLLEEKLNELQNPKIIERSNDANTHTDLSSYSGEANSGSGVHSNAGLTAYSAGTNSGTGTSVAVQSPLPFVASLPAVSGATSTSTTNDASSHDVAASNNDAFSHDNSYSSSSGTTTGAQAGAQSVSGVGVDAANLNRQILTNHAALSRTTSASESVSGVDYNKAPYSSNVNAGVVSGSIPVSAIGSNNGLYKGNTFSSFGASPLTASGSIPKSVADVAYSSNRNTPLNIHTFSITGIGLNPTTGGAYSNNAAIGNAVNPGVSKNVGYTSNSFDASQTKTPRYNNNLNQQQDNAEPSLPMDGSLAYVKEQPAVLNEQKPGLLKRIKEKLVGMFSSSKKLNENKSAYGSTFDITNDMMKDMNLDFTDTKINDLNRREAAIKNFNEMDFGLGGLSRKAEGLHDYNLDFSDVSNNKLSTRDFNNNKDNIVSLGNFNDKYPIFQSVNENDYDRSTALKPYVTKDDIPMKDFGLKDFNLVDKDTSFIGNDVRKYVDTQNPALQAPNMRDFQRSNFNLKDMQSNANYGITKEQNIRGYDTDELTMPSLSTKQVDSNIKDMTGNEASLNDYGARGSRMQGSDAQNTFQPAINTNRNGFKETNQYFLRDAKDEREFYKMLESNLERDRQFTREVMDAVRRNSGNL